MRHIVFALIMAAAVRTIAAAPDNPKNLARGQTYEMEPAPSYHLCTDADDRTQLTDGVYTEGYFWTQKTTVGWQNAHLVTITIDLENVQPIEGLSFNTAAGTAGVHWPRSILVLVSDDSKTYYLAGDVVELSAVENGEPKAQGYGLHRFITRKFRTRGQYVKLLIFGTGPFVFADEIEVYKGPDAFLTAAVPGERIDDIDAFCRKIAVLRGVRRRLRLDLAEVRSQAVACDRAAVWEKTFQQIEAEIADLNFDPGPDFRTVLPLNDLHRRIFAIQAELWRSQGMSGLVVWPKNRWDPLSPTERPDAGDVAVDVEMMSNEFRGAAFNFSNAAEETARLALAIEGLPGGTNPDYITAHEVPFTDTASGVPVAAAMPTLDQRRGRYSLAVEPGMTKQVWLNFHPRTVPSGTHRGRLVIGPGRRDIPIRFKVYPFRFPDRPTLHLGGWDYTDVDARYEVTPENRAAFIQHMIEHFVDSPWATSRVLSRGRYDKDGNLIEDPDPQYFKTWLERWPNARNYYVFASVGNTFAGFKTGTPEFRNAVGNWIGWWAAKLREWKIPPEMLGILLVDEPRAHEQDDTIIAYAEVIRNAAPEVVVWEDPIWTQPWQARPRMFELSDVLCPNLPMLIAQGRKFADFYAKQREAGRTLWFYSCSGPGKLLDPYSYHRMQHWFCWKYQAAGSGFWAFGDSNGASSWNEYLALRGAYTPVFLDDRTVTAGKHMEAIREGIEDYEYLVMLRDRVAKLEAGGKSGAAIKKAKGLLESAADRVIEGQTPEALNWREDKDRSVADRVRIEILQMMTTLGEL